MAIHITGTSAVTVGTSPRGLRINFNKTFTGDCTIADGSGTLAVITNPAAQSLWEGYGFSGATTVTASATPDITVSILNVKR